MFVTIKCVFYRFPRNWRALNFVSWFRRKKIKSVRWSMWDEGPISPRFMRGFCVRKFSATVFCAWGIGLTFLQKENGANALTKCWWNWPQEEGPLFQSFFISFLHFFFCFDMKYSPRSTAWLPIGTRCTIWTNLLFTFWTQILPIFCVFLEDFGFTKAYCKFVESFCMYKSVKQLVFGEAFGWLVTAARIFGKFIDSIKIDI